MVVGAAIASHQSPLAGVLREAEGDPLTRCVSPATTPPPSHITSPHELLRRIYDHFMQVTRIDTIAEHKPCWQKCVFDLVLFAHFDFFE